MSQGGSPWLVILKLLFMMLTKNASFTNPFKKVNVWKAFDQSLLGNSPHVLKV
jgi:hypothetical protein